MLAAAAVGDDDDDCGDRPVRMCIEVVLVTLAQSVPERNPKREMQ